jgi:cell fate (sporulation/competence/biofilm development) regulator YlbF (YheA/YmcA/DUF963 family)
LKGRDEILNAARSLADAIKQSGIYLEYRASLLKVHEQPALDLKLRIFKQLQAEAEAGLQPGQPVPFETEKDISHRYTELVNNSDAALFLSSECEMLNIYTEIMEIIDGSCEIELF